jgi:hypothetical protein
MERMLNKSSTLRRRPLWIIPSHQNNQKQDALTIDPDLDGGFLAVFSFEEEAEAYLSLLEDDEKKGWHSEQTTAGGLVAILLGPCANVKGVALDPLPWPLSREMLPLVSMNRGYFLKYLLEDVAGPQGGSRTCARRR